MRFSSFFHDWPTLSECEERDIVAIDFWCGRCNRRERIHVRRIIAPEDVPLDKVEWSCAGCGGRHITISTVRRKQLQVLLPTLKLSGIVPKPRRANVS